MKNKLNILWTNANPLTAEHMVMMYATNAMLKGWWDEVTIIIWGATAKLVAEDENMQGLIRTARQAGVQFSACVACANNLGVFEAIADLGIELKGWGQPLTELIKADEKLITI